VLFMPFDDASEIADWSVAGTNAAFDVHGGQLVETGSSDLAILWRNDLGTKTAWLTTHVTYGPLEPFTPRSIALMTAFVRNATPDFGNGAGCGEEMATVGSAALAYVDFNGSGYSFSQMAAGDTSPGHGVMYTAHLETSGILECTATPGQTKTHGAAHTNGTGINFALWGTTGAFDYLVVID
jgi:hypothetical protein